MKFKIAPRGQKEINQTMKKEKNLYTYGVLKEVLPFWLVLHINITKYKCT